MTSRVTRRGIAAAGGLGLFAVAVVAHGAAPVLAGWAPCPGGGECLTKGQARIELRHGLTADPALDGELVHDEDIQVGGRPGHLMVAFGDGVLTAVVVVGTDAVVLRAPLAEAGAAAHAWSALLEAQSVPATGAGGAMKLVNLETDCAATVYVDGAPHTLAAGATAEVTLATGRAFVEWQERDGGHRMAAAAPGAEARVGCPPPPQAATVTLDEPEPAAPLVSVDAAVVVAADAAVAEPAGVTGPRAALAPVFAGARSAVLFYRGLWSVVLVGKLWETPRSIDRLMLKLLQHRPRDRWDSLATYTSLHAQLERAVANAAGDEAKLTEVRRVATELLLSTAQVPSQRGCASVQDAALAADARVQAVDCAANRIGRMGTAAKDVLGLRMLNAAALAPPSGDVIARLTELAR